MPVTVHTWPLCGGGATVRLRARPAFLALVVGHDVIAVAASVELAGSADVTILDVATADGRCLVTENVRDFTVLVRHTSHGGVLFVHARRWPRTRAGLHALAAALHDGSRAAASPVSTTFAGSPDPPRVPPPTVVRCIGQAVVVLVPLTTSIQ
ncbi:MAG: DUF5615 family PIN-like protein [Pseudonocardiaceae bacterium]